MSELLRVLKFAGHLDVEFLRSAVGSVGVFVRASISTLRLMVALAQQASLFVVRIFRKLRYLAVRRAGDLEQLSLLVVKVVISPGYYRWRRERPAL